MKTTSKCDGAAELDYAEIVRRREKIWLHLVELLRPHAASDPVMPDICEELAMEAEYSYITRAALGLSQLGLHSASQQLGPKHAKTLLFAELAKDHQALVARM